MSRFGWLWNSPEIKASHSPDDVSIAVAESVTAGALANTLCSKPGASSYFKGGIVAYSITSKKEILGIDVKYAEQNNHANIFTTTEMAKAAAKMFKARFGMATTGYSLPMKREANPEKGECELNIVEPYVIIVLYDTLTDRIQHLEKRYKYDPNSNRKMQRANVQALSAIAATELYESYIAPTNDYLVPNLSVPNSPV